MKSAVLVALLAACGTDVMPLPGSGTGSDPAMGSDPGTGSDPTMPPMITQVMGHITADTTWSGIIQLTGATTIDKNVTVTVVAGTTIEAELTTSGITVLGTLDIEGTSAQTVLAHAASGTTRWPGIAIGTGGQLIAHYLVQVGGGIHLSSTAMATIVDSEMSRQTGDFLTMSTGTLDVSYSSIGVDVRANDTTHCDMHFAGGLITVTHTNISTSAYGLMFYGGQGANFTYDNWFQNGTDVAFTTGTPVSGDFSSSWFERGTAPTGTGIVANNLSSTRVADAGPRP